MWVQPESVVYKWLAQLSYPKKRRKQDNSMEWDLFNNIGFYLEGVWLWRISGGYLQEMMGLFQENIF